MRLPADDGHHEGQAERPGADERFRGAPDADPDRQARLQGAGVDRLASQRRAVPPGPGHLLARADLQQQIELLGKEGVIVVELEAEEREGLDEGAAADHQLGAAARDEVQGGKLLEDPHRVVGAQDLDGARQADALRPRRRRGQDDGGRRVEELPAVVLADPEDVEAHLVGEFHLVEEVVHPLDRAQGDPGDGVGNGGGKAVDSDLHPPRLGWFRGFATHRSPRSRLTD